jgi:hypothetical protein
MFVGHFGIAQLGKAARREIPFLWLLVAAYLPDLVRVLLAPLTAHSEILSHSIPAVTILALAIAALWQLRGGNLIAAAIIALACLLHWPADVFTGCKPSILNGPWFGMLSYRRPVSDLLVEGALLIGGWLAARRRGFAIGRVWLVIAFAAQLAFLASMYVGAEFLIGDREWTWRPSVSLVPKRQPLESLVCRAQTT